MSPAAPFAPAARAGSARAFRPGGHERMVVLVVPAGVRAGSARRTAMQIWEDFKKFAVRGNVVDMAAGVVIGAAFGNIVKAIVDHLIMPPVGVLTGGIDFSRHYIVLKSPHGPGPHATPEEMVKAGAVLLQYGVVINTLVSFFIVALCVFLLMRLMGKLYRKQEEEATTKECPECAMSIPIKAVRCGHCTTTLKAA
jgi:large conductance mechanosensitive channel